MYITIFTTLILFWKDMLPLFLKKLFFSKSFCFMWWWAKFFSNMHAKLNTKYVIKLIFYTENSYNITSFKIMVGPWCKLDIEFALLERSIIYYYHYISLLFFPFLEDFSLLLNFFNLHTIESCPKIEKFFWHSN